MMRLVTIGCMMGLQLFSTSASTLTVRVDPANPASFEEAKRLVRSEAGPIDHVQVVWTRQIPPTYTLAFGPDDSGRAEAIRWWRFPSPQKPIERIPSSERLGDVAWFRVNGVTTEVLHAGSDPKRPKKARFEVSVPESAVAAASGVSESDLDRLEFTVYHKWDVTRYAVKKLDIPGRTVTVESGGMKPWNRWGKEHRFELTLRPENDAPHPAVLIQGTPDHPVHHLGIEGLHVARSGSNESPEGFGPMQAAATIEAAVMVDHARGIEFNQCKVYNAGGYGFWIRENCQDVTVRRCQVKWPGAGGLRIGTLAKSPAERVTRTVVVEDSVFAHGGRRFPPAVGIWIGQAHSNRVSHCEVADFFYTGLSVGWTWGYGESRARDNLLEHNHVHHIGRGVLSDMGGVYTLGVQPGTRINQNVFHHIHSEGYGGWGLYTDEGSSHIEMASNVVWSVKTGGFHQHYGRENDIHHNVLLRSRVMQLQATRVEDHVSYRFHHNLIWWDRAEATLTHARWTQINAERHHNLYWREDGRSPRWGAIDWAAWQETGKESHSIVADPGLRWTSGGRPILPDKGPGAGWAFANKVIQEAGPRTGQPPVRPLPDPRVDEPW